MGNDEADGERERCESASARERLREEGRSDVARSVGLNYPDVPVQIRLPVYAHNVVRNVQRNWNSCIHVCSLCARRLGTY
ncbi:hypothetical protein ALC53_00264 [Atta colombica]|uniref:Uncharacterized protein n=1 Tax=Atta colombica TaxID=520822 RepID=A0A195BXK9_9HYME|nr:hypothetical protein ALC53_00264 [Atta colombica]